MTDIPITLLKKEHGIEVSKSTVLSDWSESLVIRLDCLQRGKPAVKYLKKPGRRDDSEKAIYRFARKHLNFPAPASRELYNGDDLWLLLNEAPGTLLADAESGSTRGAYLQAAEALARFHSQSISSGWTDEFPNSRLSESWAEALPASVMQAMKRRTDTGDYGEVPPSLLWEVNELAGRYWKENAATFLKLPFSLIHGDSHYGNLFLKPDADICLIDWSTAGVAPGLLDLVALWDVSDRMGQDIPAEKELLEAYIEKLPGYMVCAYSEPDDAWRVCRCFRAFMELEWFCSTEYEFGSRARRELNILLGNLSAEG